MHRKQRHTSRRVWQRLVEEEGVAVAESSVRALVGQLRRLGLLDDGTLPDRRGSLNVDDEGHAARVVLERGVVQALAGWGRKRHEGASRRAVEEWCACSPGTSLALLQMSSMLHGPSGGATGTAFGGSADDPFGS